MRRLAIPVLSLSLLVGCASQESSDRGSAEASTTAPAPRPDSPSPAASPGKDDYTFRLPIAAFSYTDAEYEVIGSAEQVLARDCMKGFGLTYRPAGNSTPPKSEDRRYGITDLEGARRHGYRVPPQPDAPKAELTEDQIKVLYGKRSLDKEAEDRTKLEYGGKEIPDEGCLGKAILDFRKPYEYPAGSAAASRIAGESYDASLKDPKVRAVFEKWSSCMKRSGYDYASPMAAMEAPSFLAGEVSATERKTAVADITCKRNTGLLETWFEAESAIQKAMMKKDAAALRKLDELHGKKVNAARKILAEA
ncbi:hypothetical protein IM697_35470 [Streptomyces ferrugineus]|uniref:Lipoprotein n=1 Tax=Streptomyces ferrugineus TaxID=1413221 RepID=A0A7M2SG67_9ACTN|nr:hypothetical protein [Streptomyces ferrugineus]QOV35320.1 hypothetical protein IM697_35470 [Streptomyces ferrugineus]